MICNARRLFVIIGLLFLAIPAIINSAAISEKDGDEGNSYECNKCDLRDILEMLTYKQSFKYFGIVYKRSKEMESFLFYDKRDVKFFYKTVNDLSNQIGGLISLPIKKIFIGDTVIYCFLSQEESMLLMEPIGNIAFNGSLRECFSYINNLSKSLKLFCDIPYGIRIPESVNINIPRGTNYVELFVELGHNFSCSWALALYNKKPMFGFNIAGACVPIHSNSRVKWIIRGADELMQTIKNQKEYLPTE